MFSIQSKIKNQKSKIKSPVIAGIAGLAVIALGCVLLMIPLRLTSLSNTSRIAKLQCQEAGSKLSMRINASADIVRNYSYLIAHLAATDLIPKENKRKFMLSEMELRYHNEKSLNNLWCTFEPNALDGMDVHFINSPGSNNFGVFEPWFAEGNMANSPTLDYESIYYTIPKETRREAVTDPYPDEVNGKEIMMISFSTPIMLHDKFLGVLGTDFYIDHLNKLIATENFVGSGKLVTGNGIVVIHDNPELIGKPDNNDHREIMNKLSENKMFDEFDTSKHNDIYRVYIPIHFGKIDKPWVYIVEVPASQVYAEARKTVGLLAIIFVLLVVSVYFYMKTVEKNRELKKLHHVKDKLFSVVAHDLRGPIGALASLLKLASLKTMDVEKQLQILKDITKRVDDVYGLLDNLLRWAKNQMQGMVKSPVYFDHQNEIQTVMDALQEMAATKMITLNNRAITQEIYADRDMFSVVVRNLTTNALKYTSSGGEVSIDSKLSDNMLIISVKDTGTGMPKEVQEKLFKLSETKSQRGTDNESGTGLGLVLCAEFVKVNGGHIWFHSVQGEGSTFFFSVPIMKEEGRGKREEGRMKKI